ncbi:MAG: polysaccharide biosynthesis C-terminal domain-containing protein [Ilumatobacteraceae bacterium]|nr:polysaccharide biosynthesis C-terminal domain-containing protein [Ilumatobacteraceae bacterium]
MIRVIALTLPFAGLYEITLGALQARDEVLVAMVLDRIIRPTVQIGGMIAAGLHFASARSVTLAWAVPHVLVVIVALGLLTRTHVERRRTPDEHVSQSMLWRYTAPRSIARTAQTLTQRLDVLILAAVYPLEESGIYGTVSRCMIAGVFVATALRQTIQPQLRRLVVGGDQDSVRGLFGLSTTWLVLVSWPVYIVMMTHAPLVLSVFGDGYERGAPALVILSVAMLFATSCGLVDVVLLMLGKSWLSTVNILIALALNIVLNLILAPAYGMVGSAIGWLAAILATNLLPLLQVQRHGLSPLGRPLATAILVASATIALPMALTRLMFGTGVAPFFGVFAIALVLYGVTLWKLRSRVALDQLMRDIRRSPKSPAVA